MVLNINGNRGQDMYREILTEATGVSNTAELAVIEDIMRHDIFHSTLDFQTREQLSEAAKEAYEVLKLAKEEGIELSTYG
jgi:hypothetical protein